MADVTPSMHPGDVRRWVAIDQHKFSIVAAVLAPDGGRPEVCRIETTEKAIRRFVDRLGGPVGVAVCYEAGAGGFALWGVFARGGGGGGVVAPALGPVPGGGCGQNRPRGGQKAFGPFRGGPPRVGGP